MNKIKPYNYFYQYNPGPFVVQGRRPFPNMTNGPRDEVDLNIEIMYCSWHIGMRQGHLAFTKNII